MEAKKLKISVIILVVVIALAAIGGLMTAFLFNYNGFRPDKPTILDDGNSIYITTKLNDSYEKYRFKFKTEGQSFIIESEKNTISKEEVIEKGGVLGKTYKVSVCYVAKKEGNSSEYSKEISWLCYSYLLAPEIAVNEMSKTLSWQKIENADFYRIFVNGIEGGYTDTEGFSFDYSDLKGGQKNFSVVACSKKAGYKNSLPSSTVILNHTRILKGFSAISFDRDSKLITAEADEEYRVVNIILGPSVTEVRTFDCKQEGEKFIYTIDISAFYNNEDLVGINAKSIDEHNISSNDYNLYAQ